ncbi:MAG TPA: hypothetical protein PKC18_09385, partial [Lacipirellulaceae bacterium]|nr:hypothetical protein [Lacipirellulaceae bacterium]
ERTGVEQQLDAFAGRELPLGMLGFDPPLAPAELGLGPLLLQTLNDVLHGTLGRWCRLVLLDARSVANIGSGQNRSVPIVA